MLENKFRIRTKKQLQDCIREDLSVRGIAKLPLLFAFSIKPLPQYTIMLRKVEYLENTSSNFITKTYTKIQKLRLKKMGLLLGLTIPLNTCGPGLFIVHWGSVVISGKSQIGKNCRIHSCVNIGEYKSGAPIIGNNVYIGPGAKIFGSIKIGNNVTIGANAVVNRSFPDNVIIAGVPAKIIKQK